MTTLVRLLYASKVAPNFGPMDMRNIGDTESATGLAQ
jgi:hypothetical protein